MHRNDVEKEVYDLLNEAEPEKRRSMIDRTWLSFVILLGLVIAIAYFSFLSFFKPQGRILQPKAGATVSNIFEVQGVTKNLPHDRKYVWITVDVPQVGLCWPKRQVFKINDRFSAKIDERGPNQEFIVSLYAVPSDDHQGILKWAGFKQQIGSLEGFQ